MFNSNYLMVLAFLLASCDGAAEDPPSAEDGGTASCMCEPGLPGSKGEMGPAGPVGEQGARGPAGETGAEGPAGPRGVVGPQGEAGARGEQGEPGVAGTAGPRGAIGPQGEAGPRGERGEPGADGVAGPMGPQGEPGSNGIDGVDGNSCSLESVAEGVRVTCDDQEVLIRHGEIGPQGDQGIPGLPGDVGPVGPQGEQGIAGRDGRDLVRACPQDSESIVINGHLVYCYKKLVFEEPITWRYCYRQCMANGLFIMDQIDLLQVCGADPGLFDDDPAQDYIFNGSFNQAGSSAVQSLTAGIVLMNPGLQEGLSYCQIQAFHNTDSPVDEDNLRISYGGRVLAPRGHQLLAHSGGSFDNLEDLMRAVEQSPRGCLCGKRM